MHTWWCIRSHVGGEKRRLETTVSRVKAKAAAAVAHNLRWGESGPTEWTN